MHAPDKGQRRVCFRPPYFNVILKILSILFFIAEIDRRSFSKYRFTTGHLSKYDGRSPTLGSFFFFTTKANAFFNSSVCSSVHMCRPLQALFFFPRKTDKKRRIRTRLCDKCSFQQLEPRIRTRLCNN